MGDVIIKEEDIDKWRAEKAELENEMQKLKAKLDTVNRKLDALALLTRSQLKDKPIATQEVRLLPADVVFDAIADAKEPLSPKQIREKVIKTDFPVERWGNNFAYFYTTLKRLVDDGKVHKTKDGDYFTFGKESE